MKTKEELRQELQEDEQKLHNLIEEYHSFLGGMPNSSDIQQIESEIKQNIISIKTFYHQILSLRNYAKTTSAPEEKTAILQKTHTAFLLLIEFNKQLSLTFQKKQKLLNELEHLLQAREIQVLVSDYQKRITELHQAIDVKHEELRKLEEETSVSSQLHRRITAEIQEYQHQEAFREEQIAYREEDLYRDAPTCATCNAKMVLRENSDQTFFWGCPNYGKTQGHRGKTFFGDPSSIRQNYNIIKSLKKNKTKTPSVTLTEAEKEALQHSTLRFSLFKTEYNNYLFQSLAVPEKVQRHENFEELLKYSRFRIFTYLPQSHPKEDITRTVCSLALRLMNRGVVLTSNQQTEAKIKRHFQEEDAFSFLSDIHQSIQYKKPQNNYDSNIERQFAEYYFPKVLGSQWGTYVYPQVPFDILLPERDKFTDQRADFLVCIEDKKIILELDGEEHQKQQQHDKYRDDALKQNGYIVKRIPNQIAKSFSKDLLDELKELFDVKPQSALVSAAAKHLVACKIVHQTAIAIIKMLEEGHMPFICRLHLEISSELFSQEEQQLLLLFATEEASELLLHFAELYGINIHLDFFNENAENFWIRIGDGDENRNSIVIRDISLPINYLCSIHPFSLVLPDKNAITESLIEYFLQYVYGYASFRPGQFLAIRRTLLQKDSIVLLPTGSGKSIIYQLCSMLLPGITVVISPLRSLIEDQVTNLIARGIFNVASIYSDDKKSKADMLKKAMCILKNHSATMLYIAPERMQMPEFRKKIRELCITNTFCLIAIDEAHCVSEWGHDFRAAYLQIGRSCRSVFSKDNFTPPMIALTGTASDNVLHDVKRDLEITATDAIITPKSFDRIELHYAIIPCVPDLKYTHIQELLSQTVPTRFNSPSFDIQATNGQNMLSGIVFTTLATKEKSHYSAWALYNKLAELNPKLPIGTYFSSIPDTYKKDDKSSADEEDEMLTDQEDWMLFIKAFAKSFKENECKLLIATKAFGMGIDKANIRYIIHNSLSNSIEQYYQEVGRAGRDGEHAECFLLFSTPCGDDYESILDPNLEWTEFHDLYSKANREELNDIGSLLYFHNNSFQGTKYEKEIMLAVLNSLNPCAHKSQEKKITSNDIWFNLWERKWDHDKNSHPLSAEERSHVVIKFLKSTESLSKEALKKEFKKQAEKIKKEHPYNFHILLAHCLYHLSEHLSKIDKIVDVWNSRFWSDSNSEDKKRVLLAGLSRIAKNDSNNPKSQDYIPHLYKKLSHYPPKEFSNIIAKAIIRLVTLGIVVDYGFDYSKKEFSVHIGTFDSKTILENYLMFVDNCSRGRAADEKKHLSAVMEESENDFIDSVIDRYINLVYSTIEKGRRRAIHSMYQLAKGACQITEPDEQDAYIRKEVLAYLEKDDTVDRVQSSKDNSGLSEISLTYPFYPDDVYLSPQERENAKKTAGYTAHVLEEDPFHPGLLYLHAITSIKSRSYSNVPVLNDIFAAWENSKKYNIPEDVSLAFFVKTLNLTYNSSKVLFDEAWRRIDRLPDGSLLKGKIVDYITNTNEIEIGEHFKIYLLCYIATQALQKMIGE